jgi:RecB family endonuclease NucS
VAAVRLIVARCEVVYTGRLTAVLPEALRLLMLKSDGSVMVHADTGRRWRTVALHGKQKFACPTV